MRRPAALILPLLCLALAGCGLAFTRTPDGRPLLVTTFLLDRQIGSVKFNADSSFELVGLATKVSVDATRAVAAGVAEGAVKGLVKP